MGRVHSNHLYSISTKTYLVEHVNLQADSSTLKWLATMLLDVAHHYQEHGRLCDMRNAGAIVNAIDYALNGYVRANVDAETKAMLDTIEYFDSEDLVDREDD